MQNVQTYFSADEKHDTDQLPGKITQDLNIFPENTQTTSNHQARV